MAMNQERLDQLADLAKTSNDLRKEITDHIKDGERLREKVSKHQSALLQEFQDEVKR